MELRLSEVQSQQIPREQYLERFSGAGFEPDRANLEKLCQLFQNAMRRLRRKGRLLAVGGSVTKPLPRKDIDLLLVLEPGQGDPNREVGESYYDLSLKEFQVTKKIVDEMLQNGNKFQVSYEIPPTIDEEFQSPSILKNEGTITIQRRGATPIEIIRYPINQHQPNSPHEPYVVQAQE